MTPAIEVTGVRKTFRVKGGLLGHDRHVVAVDDISFAVPQGGVLGVVGESGCGKSTLARLILGLLSPDSGAITVEGQRVLAMDRKARARLIQPARPKSSAMTAFCQRHWWRRRERFRSATSNSMVPPITVCTRDRCCMSIRAT